MFDEGVGSGEDGGRAHEGEDEGVEPEDGGDLADVGVDCVTQEEELEDGDEEREEEGRAVAEDVGDLVIRDNRGNAKHTGMSRHRAQASGRAVGRDGWRFGWGSEGAFSS